MPRISLWKNEKFSDDAKWIDKLVSEEFTLGGVDLYVHLYTGPLTANAAVSNGNLTPTQPTYSNPSAQNIQDLLFLENRDRKYARDIYRLRGHYNPQDLDLDLSQFGLIIASGTVYITVHTVDMVNMLGRKLMSGDVLELPNLKEFYALDSIVPVALKRYYVVQEGTRPANGYSPTWWNHLWRLKCTPMVDSQEFSDILNQPVLGVDGLPILVNGNTISYSNISSSTNTYLGINDAVIAEANVNVPESGYNTDPLWAPLFINGDPSQGPAPLGSSPQQKFTGYLVGDGTAIDGYPVTPATSFPSSPTLGQYVLRQDYFPARLYRWDGTVWQFADKDVRSNLTPGTGNTQKDTYINNANVFVNSQGNTEPTIQSITTLFRPDLGGFN